MNAQAQTLDPINNCVIGPKRRTQIGYDGSKNVTTIFPEKQCDQFHVRTLQFDTVGSGKPKQKKSNLELPFKH